MKFNIMIMTENVTMMLLMCKQAIITTAILNRHFPENNALILHKEMPGLYPF